MQHDGDRNLIAAIVRSGDATERLAHLFRVGMQIHAPVAGAGAPQPVPGRLMVSFWKPLPASTGFFADRMREFTPCHEISPESRPYSILGQRFITTVRPACSAFSAAASFFT